MSQEGQRERSARRRWKPDPGILVGAVLMVFAMILSLILRPWISPAEEPEPVKDVPVEVIIRYETAQEQEARDQETLIALARTIWGEARGCSTTEQAAVVWCVLNRADRDEWPDDPLEVVQQPYQFAGYDPDNPVWSEHLALAADVLDRWELEKTAVGDVGRVLPKEYVYFDGDGLRNYFWTEFKDNEAWDWSLDSPYEGENP